MKALLGYGADPYRPNGSRTLLMCAAESSSTDTAKLLLAYADVNARDRRGDTALCFAVSRKRAGMAKFLIDEGADKDLVYYNRDQTKSYTALMIAASNDDEDTLKVLIDAGAALDYRDQDGKTALSIARDRSEYVTTADKIVGMLVAAGAKP